MNKKDICFVRAKLKDDYVFDAIKQYGYNILIPYKDKNLFLRLLREIWFRTKLPGRRIWYNKKIKDIEAKVFIVLDPLATPGLFNWIKETHTDARIVLQYENRVDTTIKPDDVADFVEKWSYDVDDCEQYNMKFIHPCYFEIYGFRMEERKDKQYDVLYLGRDKGRLEQILEYERIFNVLDLKTYFHICADRSFLKFKNSLYKNVLPYKEYLNLLKESNSVLNIVREGQTSITQRELEAVFDNVKCITTNRAIKEFELYDKSRYFVLGMDPMEEMKAFFELPFKKVEHTKLKEYYFTTVIENMLSNKQYL